MPTPATAFRFTSSELEALDALAADMRVNRTDALRKLIADEVDSRGLLDRAVESFVSDLIERYGPEAVIVASTNGGATPAGATATIDGRARRGVCAVLLDGSELRIEDPDGPASILVATIAGDFPAGLRWQGTLSQLADAVASGVNR